MDPKDPNSTTRYLINLLDTFQTHESKEVCNCSWLLCKRAECRKELYKVFAPDTSSEMQNKLLHIFTKAVDNLSNLITNCLHFRDKDGFLLSTIPFLKVVPTPTPTTTLILQVPEEDADAASELASEPNPCSVKQKIRSSPLQFVTLCAIASIQRRLSKNYSRPRNASICCLERTLSLT